MRIGTAAQNALDAAARRLYLRGRRVGASRRAPGGDVGMLGAVLAVLSAATFAFNNAAARRGVITGSPIQGMAITIPVGLLGFVPIALVTGLLARFPHLAPRSMAWMAGVGLLHFLVGRYC